MKTGDTVGKGLVRDISDLIKYESEDNVITHRLIEPQFMLLNWPIWYLVA